MKYGQILNYQDELNDEVIEFDVKKKEIDDNYKYIHKNIFYRIYSWITYRIFATPIVWIWFKLFRRTKYVNKKILKTVKGGYFVYSNHVEQQSDAFSPALICFPQKPHVVVNSDNVSMPIVGRLTRMWGALPLPDTVTATKNFTKAMEQIVSKGNPIVIYPEAHLWPYYTKIRPFSDKSFRYPVIMNKPIFTFTTTFVKRKEGKKPKIVIYVDGPFYPDNNLSRVESQKVLRDLVYNTMVDRSQNNNYMYCIYSKKGDSND